MLKCRKEESLTSLKLEYGLDIDNKKTKENGLKIRLLDP